MRPASTRPFTPPSSFVTSTRCDSSARRQLCRRRKAGVGDPKRRLTVPPRQLSRSPSGSAKTLPSLPSLARTIAFQQLDGAAANAAFNRLKAALWGEDDALALSLSANAAADPQVLRSCSLSQRKLGYLQVRVRWSGGIRVETSPWCRQIPVSAILPFSSCLFPFVMTRASGPRRSYQRFSDRFRFLTKILKHVLTNQQLPRECRDDGDEDLHEDLTWTKKARAQ